MKDRIWEWAAGILAIIAVTCLAVGQYLNATGDTRRQEALPQAAPTAMQPAEPLPLELGQSATADGMQLRVLAYDDNIPFDGSMYVDDLRMIGVQVEITNTGPSVIDSVPDPGFFTADGIGYDLALGTGDSLDTDELPTLHLRQGQSATGWMVYLIPPDDPTPSTVTFPIGDYYEVHEWTVS